MIEKMAGGTPQLAGMVQKLNEVIDSLNSQTRDVPHRQIPTNVEHVQAIEMMTARIRTGPFQAVTGSGKDLLTDAIGVALDNLQASITAYKGSLAT